MVNKIWRGVKDVAFAIGYVIGGYAAVMACFGGLVFLLGVQA